MRQCLASCLFLLSAYPVFAHDGWGILQIPPALLVYDLLGKSYEQSAMDAVRMSHLTETPLLDAQGQVWALRIDAQLKLGWHFPSGRRVTPECGFQAENNYRLWACDEVGFTDATGKPKENYSEVATPAGNYRVSYVLYPAPMQIDSHDFSRPVCLSVKQIAQIWPTMSRKFDLASELARLSADSSMTSKLSLQFHYRISRKPGSFNLAPVLLQTALNPARILFNSQNLPECKDQI
jgi:hypothetical protein